MEEEELATKKNEQKIEEEKLTEEIMKEEEELKLSNKQKLMEEKVAERLEKVRG